MTNRRRFPLIWKLLLLQASLLLSLTGSIWLSFDLLAADYFMQLMKKFPDVHTEEVNAMFVAANNRSLLIVGGIAIAVSALVGFAFARHLLAPLHEMNRSTRKIAVGDYNCEIELTTNDELAELAASFNSMMQSLARNEQIRKSMVVDVAHELRTPLSNLQGYIEALQDGVVESSPKVLAVLHGESLRLVRLSEGLLKAARDGIEQERRRVPLRPVDLLEETLELFRPRFRRRGIAIRADLSERSPQVLADADQLKQVFSNLVQNCLQYAPESTWMEVRVIDRSSDLRIVFSNPGEGIAAEQLPLIFEPYFRVDKSRNRNTGGAGVGLAIVHSLVEQHGGKVGASSDPSATRVWIELPKMAD